MRRNSQKANQRPSLVENKQSQTGPTNSQTKLSSTSTLVGSVSAARDGPSLRQTFASNSRPLSISSDDNSPISTPSGQAVIFDESGLPAQSASSGGPGMKSWITHGPGFDYEADLSVSGLTADLHDELMGYFWEYYNTVLPVVDRDTLPNGKDGKDSTSSMRFLHICILAIGFRYVNREDSRVQALLLPDRESTLHLRAKQLVEGQFERLGGVPAVQALLLLGDLEAGVGRYKTGRMFAGKPHIV